MKTIAIMISIAALTATSVCAQDVPLAPLPDWKILSPKNGQEITAPIPWITIIARIPSGAKGRLQLEKLEEQGTGECRTYELAGGPNAHFFLAPNGNFFLPGTYSLKLFPDPDSPDVIDQVRFTVVESETLTEFPLLTTPFNGSIFYIPRGGKIPVNIAGVGGGVVWLQLYKDGNLLGTTSFDLVGAPKYTFSITYDLAVGSYQAVTYTMDPSHYNTRPTSSTTFDIVEDPLAEPVVLGPIEPDMQFRSIPRR